MEHAIKYVRLGEGNEQTGLKPALCFRGQKKAYAVMHEEGCIRAYEIALQVYDKSAPVSTDGAPYPVDRFVQHMRIFIDRGHACSRRAAALLGAGISLPSDAGLPDDDVGAGEPSVSPRAEKAPKETPKPAAVAPQSAKVRRSARPAPGGAVKAPKGPKAAKETAEIKLNNVAKLAAELGLAPTALRVKLRAAGMHAPYDDMKAMRKALK